MQNNVSLTAKLSNAMRLILDMANKLNLKPIQEPEDKDLHKR